MDDHAHSTDADGGVEGIGKRPPPDSFRRRANYIIGITALLVALAVLVWQLMWLVGLIFAGVLFAIFLRTGADFIAHITRGALGKPIGPGWSLLAFILILLGSTAVFAVLAIPALARQATQLTREIPESVRQLQNFLEERGLDALLPGGVADLITGGDAAADYDPDAPQIITTAASPAVPGVAVTLPPHELDPDAPAPADDDDDDDDEKPIPHDETPDVPPEVDEQTGGLASTIQEGVAGLATGDGDMGDMGGMGGAVAWAWAAVGGITTFGFVLVFVAFTGLYMAAEPRLYRNGVLWLVPPRHRAAADGTLGGLGKVLQFWLYGQLLEMVFIGTMAGLGLWVLGVPLPFINGVIAGILTFIPNFGPIVGAAPAVLLALTAQGRFVDGPVLALVTAGWFTFIQSFEAYFLTPMVQKKAVEMPPALLITTQLGAGIMLGILGITLAAPATAAAMVVVRRLWVVGDVRHEHPKDRMHESDGSGESG